MEIKNLKRVSQRIKKAIRGKKNIILYGDADLDGTSALLILEEAIKNLGGKITAVYFPDREKEGYGINKKALEFLREKAPALLILVDCGISNFDEIKMAKKIGFEVIVIDHHKILDKVPEASIVVDPKQEGDNYPFKELCTAGIVYYLSRLLLGKKLEGLLDNSFLELTALATLADMMPEKEDNKTLIEKGLEALPNTYRPGLRAFLDVFDDKQMSMREKAFKIISCLSAGEVKEHLTDIYLILRENDIETARIMVQDLVEKNRVKHELINGIIEEIKKKVSNERKIIVFEGDENWPVALLGNVASKIQTI